MSHSALEPDGHPMSVEEYMESTGMAPLTQKELADARAELAVVD